jgi:kinesin family protein 5
VLLADEEAAASPYIGRRGSRGKPRAPSCQRRMSETAGVKVFCRFRPFNRRERDLGADKAVDFQFSPGQLQFTGEGRKYTFPFDYCWDGTCHQQDVYEHCAAQYVQDVFEGYNGTIFAYGQTGAGKSWSMMGDKSVEDLKGIIPRAGDAIFDRISRNATGTQFSVKCSYLEVYREAIKDLLNPVNDNLPVREHPSRGIYVDGLTEAAVATADDIADVLSLGDSARAVASTNMNAVSSRSHSVFIVTVSQRNEEGSTKAGKLNLVDLAGSEKISKTGASGQTLEEAKMINKSLSAVRVPPLLMQPPVLMMLLLRLPSLRLSARTLPCLMCVTPLSWAK